MKNRQRKYHIAVSSVSMKKRASMKCRALSATRTVSHQRICLKQKMASKKNIGIVKPILTKKCARCGKWFAACHPKDTQTLCERCRENGVEDTAKSDNI